jgi:5-hydroxyisourate hydrolase
MLEFTMAKLGFLTTHVLDTARGCPAMGVAIDLYRLREDERSHLVSTLTNDDGRTDQPIIPEGKLEPGTYELVFRIGDYFKGHVPESAHPFVDVVPIRFGIDDAGSHYHVPLLASPFSFSTYRGS